MSTALADPRSAAATPRAVDPGRRMTKVVARYQNGRVVKGFCLDYLPVRPGFFLLPADLKSNADRCHGVVAATARISLLGAGQEAR